MVPKNKTILPLQVQREVLKRFNENAEIRLGGKKLSWTGVLIPSPVSIAYTVKIVYSLAESPRIYVLDPELILAHGEHLPHVYSTLEKKLCLYYQDHKGWNPSKLIANTIVLWASEWLYHYEIWVATGQWNGGGTVHK
jgi:hypothetical protein